MNGFRRRPWCALPALMLMLVAGTAAAGELPPAQGPVLVTIAGAVANSNRGPVEPFTDAFFAYHEIAFTRAAEFDLAGLESLGMHELTASYPNWPGESRFEGPWLRDVLAAAGATGERLRVVALDGYAAEVPLSDLDQHQAMLAIKRDGRYLGIGGRGPAWLVYPRAGEAPDDAGLVWAAFAILVE